MNAPHVPSPAVVDPLEIAGRAYRSRLLVGTGKYKDFAETRAAIVASGAQIVTVAIRRTNIGQDPSAPSLLDVLPPVRVHLSAQHRGLLYSRGRRPHAQGSRASSSTATSSVKLEVLGDPHTLFPNVRATLTAAETLVRDGFDVMVYTTDDPIIARELEAIGCVAIMPLASLIGSGMGILNPWNLKLIIDAAKVPVLVDAASARRRMRRSRWSWAARAC